jgi:hypothetical protein
MASMAEAVLMGTEHLREIQRIRRCSCRLGLKPEVTRDIEFIAIMTFCPAVGPEPRAGLFLFGLRDAEN